MFHILTSHSPDLLKLNEAGYSVSIEHNHLVISQVPYLDCDRNVRLGKLISELSLAGNKTIKPKTHVALFSGMEPHDASGSPLRKIINSSSAKKLGPDLIANYSFSSKPSAEGYKDYFEKMSTYADILSAEAQAVDTNATAKVFSFNESSDPTSIFAYLDTASSRSGITCLSEKLKLPSIAIIGLGGTGSYILDFLAKSPINKISLFDDDVFLQHSAFRSPGAASSEELSLLPKKVDYYKDKYQKLHLGIEANPIRIEPSNFNLLKDFSFVFLCIDGGQGKEEIIDALEKFEVAFIDVGMGLDEVEGAILGSLRTTLSTPSMRSHIHENKRISLAGDGQDNLYSRNIQVVELNALNASLAVIKFKKYLNFYMDLDKEHHSIYEIDGNILFNEDKK